MIYDLVKGEGYILNFSKVRKEKKRRKKVNINENKKEQER